jgi:hypothetical protein
MKEDPQSSPESKEARQRLADLSKGLTHLHKTLIESEKVGYEGSFGKIETSGEFLQLLMNDPWFAWLHPVSELIAAADEALDDKTPVTAALANTFYQQAHHLLSPTEAGEGFGRHYYDALQRDPEVVLSHAIISRLWKPPALPEKSSGG